MAINYGSNEVRSAGKIIGGDGQSAGRTLYFYNSSSSDWNTLDNWWFDRDHTIPSDSLPTDEDTAVILSDITTNSGSFVADTIIFDSGDLSSSYNGYNISEVRNIILKNSRALKGNGTIGSSNTGTKVRIDLYDDSYLDFNNSATIYGDVFLHETSYIHSSSSLITIEGNVVVTSSGGTTSFQPIYGNNGITILGDLRVVGNSSSITTIRYVKVLGKTELFQNVQIQECVGSTYGFYGPVTLTDDCTISTNTYFYNDVTLNDNSKIDGNSIYFYSYSSSNAADYKNSTLTLNTSSYFAGNTNIYMYGGTLVLNTSNNSNTGSTVSINGDSYTTVEYYTDPPNGTGSSTSITCGTIKIFRGVNFGTSLPSLNGCKKIQFFNDSILLLAGTFSPPSDCMVEFYDDSYIGNNTILSLSGAGVAKFFDRSYIIGTVTGSAFVRNVPTLLSPSSFSSTQDNYDPGFADILRLEATSSNQDITGLLLKDRYVVVIVNIGGTHNITLKHENSNSTDVNRFITPTGGDHIIPPDGTTTLMYDTATTRWRVL